MKKTILFLLGVVVMTSFTACSPEEDIKNPDFPTYKPFEEFTSNTTNQKSTRPKSSHNSVIRMPASS